MGPEVVQETRDLVIGVAGVARHLQGVHQGEHDRALLLECLQEVSALVLVLAQPPEGPVIQVHKRGSNGHRDTAIWEPANHLETYEYRSNPRRERNPEWVHPPPIFPLVPRSHGTATEQEPPYMDRRQISTMFNSVGCLHESALPQLGLAVLRHIFSPLDHRFREGNEVVEVRVAQRLRASPEISA